MKKELQKQQRLMKPHAIPSDATVHLPSRQTTQGSWHAGTRSAFLQPESLRTTEEAME